MKEEIKKILNFYTIILDTFTDVLGLEEEKEALLELTVLALFSLMLSEKLNDTNSAKLASSAECEPIIHYYFNATA